MEGKIALSRRAGPVADAALPSLPTVPPMPPVAGAGGLVAVVVTCNRLAQLQITLPRLLADPGTVLARVVVVDNASDDGTAGWLAAQHDPRLMVLRQRRNLGGAGGFELGMRHAVAAFDPDWLVLMDDDARPEPGALAQFLAGDRTGWQICAAAVRDPEGQICAPNRPSLNPFRRMPVFLRTLLGGGRAAFHLQDSDFAPDAPERAVDGASFVGLFVSRAAVARFGYPRGDMFIYGEDAHYTLSLSRAGGRIGFLPGVRFQHAFSGVDAATGRQTPLWKVYYHHRNLLLIYRMVAGPWFWPALLIVLPKWLSRTRVYGGQRRAFLRLFARALRDGLAGRTGQDHAAILALAEAPPVTGSAGRYDDAAA